MTTSGNYTIVSTSKIDTYGYIYAKRFYPLYPSLNLIRSNDDDDNNDQFIFDINAQSMMAFTLVVTTYNLNVMGVFSIIAIGPAFVSFSRLNITSKK